MISIHITLYQSNIQKVISDIGDIYLFVERESTLYVCEMAEISGI